MTRNGDGQRLNGLARLLARTPELRDAYASLLAGLRLNRPLESGHTILVTSTQPREGKTTVAACLAITAVLAGEAVLLVDGDLRRPWLASEVQIPDSPGLGEMLEGRIEAAAAIHSIGLFEGDRGGGGALSVLTAGQRSAAFLPAVDRANARSMFRALSQRFGSIFIDSPPILAASDALVLAGIADGVLLVVGAGIADREEVRRVKDELAPIGTPVVGAVLNWFDPKLHGRSSQPYRNHYGNSRL